MFNPAQLRAARALLNWSQEDLASRANVALMMIKNFERSLSDPRLSSMNKLKSAIEAAGVRFIEANDMHGPGVCWSNGQAGEARLKDGEAGDSLDRSANDGSAEA